MKRHESSLVRAGWLLCVGLLVCLPCAAQLAPDASSSTKERCAEAYERTQRARKEGKLLEASARAVFCGQDQCPAVLRGDCIAWAAELRVSLPTVVLDVRYQDETEIAELEVTVDGVRIRPEDVGR